MNFSISPVMILQFMSVCISYIHHVEEQVSMSLISLLASVPSCLDLILMMFFGFVLYTFQCMFCYEYEVSYEKQKKGLKKGKRVQKMVL